MGRSAKNFKRPTRKETELKKTLKNASQSQLAKVTKKTTSKSNLAGQMKREFLETTGQSQSTATSATVYSAGGMVPLAFSTAHNHTSDDQVDMGSLAANARAKAKTSGNRLKQKARAKGSLADKKTGTPKNEKDYVDLFTGKKTRSVPAKIF
ncbi:hypothetical protein H4R33_006691 [Dimargaris cristalligena]|uniref:Uncharacterized protein n=1 Tax=Dimargaris cristalligena TaxID=215637 RepID=A0A4P9ZNN0_9FUNG|nr:hypothetical protein H4R33_006691 [Dimargaris cristalligena]RKP34152.1 hypothetical protein BJ085DRAFT_34237 [Dimargaris cristalligena]|eukprot:RKP34152.1 hypothetical protein BJ085DRAFT_34237 [Dimargaris cristalligena]